MAQLFKRIGNPLEWSAADRCLLAALVMAIAACAAIELLAPTLGSLLPAKAAQLTTLGIAISIGALLYFGLTFLLRSPELHEIKSAIRKK